MVRDLRMLAGKGADRARVPCSSHGGGGHGPGAQEGGWLAVIARPSIAPGKHRRHAEEAYYLDSMVKRERALLADAASRGFGVESHLEALVADRQYHATMAVYGVMAGDVE